MRTGQIVRINQLEFYSRIIILFRSVITLQHKHLVDSQIFLARSATGMSGFTYVPAGPQRINESHDSLLEGLQLTPLDRETACVICLCEGQVGRVTLWPDTRPRWEATI